MTTSKPPVIGGRREAREQALLLLYEVEARGGDADLVLDGRTQDFDSFTLDAVYGVNDNLERIDAEISALATDWPIDRLAAIDRGVLRLAIWELFDREDIPAAVTLNEAVELAKTYGTDDSGRFVNGVLASAARRADKQ